jgi:hypothetical protein
MVTGKQERRSTKPEEIRAPCPKCGADRVAHVMASYQESDSDDDVQWWQNYRIIKCGGCNNVQLQIVSNFSEDYEHWYDEDGRASMVLVDRFAYWPPLTKRPKPEWFKSLEHRDDLLSAILSETYQALDNDMPIAAAITMRTAFDRATELIGIDPKETFKDKMTSLVTNGEIAPKDLEVLNPLIEAGSAAAHRGWTPTSDELTTMVLILEALLHRVFVLKQQADALAKRTPAKPKKKK